MEVNITYNACGKNHVP